MSSQANLGVLQVEMPQLIRKMWREKELIRRKNLCAVQFPATHRRAPGQLLCEFIFCQFSKSGFVCLSAHAEYPNLLFVVVFLYISEAACV